jgi:hypothetical protein
MAYSLEGLESAFDRLDQMWALIPDFLRKKWTDADPGHITETELVLIKTFIDKQERSRMGRDEKYLAGRLEMHKKQLKAGLYEDTVNSLRASGHLNDTTRDAWLQAIAIDKEMEKFGEKTPGVGGFLMAFLAQAQRELDQSRVVSRRFDTSRDYGEGNVFDVRSDNGASGESIGTHTLMAKDTPKSLPVYEECRVVAKFASMAIATALAKEVNEHPSTASGLDWGRLLRHYLRYPAAKPSMWESQVLEHVRNQKTDDWTDPTFDQIPDKLENPRADGPGATMLLAQRRIGTLRDDLEKRYVDLEERVDRFQLLLKF